MAYDAWRQAHAWHHKHQGKLWDEEHGRMVDLAAVHHATT
jgi:fatty acid desaturase